VRPFSRSRISEDNRMKRDLYAEVSARIVAELAAIMHDVTRFHECVERTSGGNPTGWIGVMRLAVQRVWG